MLKNYWQQQKDNLQNQTMLKTINFNNKAGHWSLLILLSLIWGSSFILIKRGLVTFSGFQVTAFRMFFAFLAFIPFIVKSLSKLSRKNIFQLIIVGFIGNGIPAFLFAKAQTRVDSSLAGMLNSVTPLFALVIGLSFFRLRTKYYNIIGIFIGLIGTLGLIYKENASLAGAIDFYALMIIVALIMYAINMNIVKFLIPELNGLVIAALSYLFIGPFSGAALLFTDFNGFNFEGSALISMVCVFLLGLTSSFVAVTMFNTLIKYTNPVFASSVTYIIPLIAILWGILDGETITLLQIISIIITILGVFLVNRD